MLGALPSACSCPYPPGLGPRPLRSGPPGRSAGRPRASFRAPTPPPQARSWGGWPGGWSARGSAGMGRARMGAGFGGESRCARFHGRWGAGGRRGAPEVERRGFGVGRSVVEWAQGSDWNLAALDSLGGGVGAEFAVASVPAFVLLPIHPSGPAPAPAFPVIPSGAGRSPAKPRDLPGEAGTCALSRDRGDPSTRSLRSLGRDDRVREESVSEAVSVSVAESGPGSAPGPTSLPAPGLPLPGGIALTPSRPGSTGSSSPGPLPGRPWVPSRGPCGPG